MSGLDRLWNRVGPDSWCLSCLRVGLLGVGLLLFLVSCATTPYSTQEDEPELPEISPASPGARGSETPAPGSVVPALHPAPPVPEIHPQLEPAARPLITAGDQRGLLLPLMPEPEEDDAQLQARREPELLQAPLPQPSLPIADEEVAPPGAAAHRSTPAPSPTTPAPSPTTPAPSPTTPAPSPAPAPTPATPASTPPAVPARELSAAVGEELNIELPGLGWIYLGSEEPDAPELVRRVHHAQSTEFMFRIRSEGTHRLRFQRQDLVRGELESQDLLLSATAGREGGNELFTRQPDASDQTRTDGSPTEPAHELSPEDAHEALAVALAEGNDTLAEQLLARLIDDGFVPEAGLLRSAAEKRAERQDFAGGIALLERYLTEYPSRTGLDRVHYLLGSWYEAPSERRDMRAARRHYSIVVSEYPRSRYLDPSQRRVQYLDRHFFEIR